MAEGPHKEHASCGVDPKEQVQDENGDEPNTRVLEGSAETVSKRQRCPTEERDKDLSINKYIELYHMAT